MPASKSRYPKKPRQQYSNPLQKAFHSFLNEYMSSLESAHKSRIDINTLTSSMPKRYTLYPPLVLVPNIFPTTPPWRAFTSHLRPQDLQALYESIIQAFTPHCITHLALNSPISLTNQDDTSNVTRSPSGLVPLYGDFGPRDLLSGGYPQPSEADFAAAFWVHITQNGGIYQTWAPLWTMFSRGNVSEKARILGEGSFEGLDGRDGLLGQELAEVAVVDMYVGIGYFAFSYLRKGVGRVFGWEINGWSVEGLRRGCGRNGWGIRVLRVDDEGLVRDQDGRDGHEALEELVNELRRDGEVRLVVFHGDNRWARRVMEKIKLLSERIAGPGKTTSWLDVRHVNLGLLPSSKLSWEDAIDILVGERDGWVHVHENVDIRQIEQKRDYVVQHFQTHSGNRRTASCSHVEQVKTYAPGVMHCVFDIRVQPKSIPDKAVENG